MVSEAVQSSIRKGDKEAFLSLYDTHAQRIYLSALDVLNDEAAARRAVKQTFLLLRRDMLGADGAIDVDARLDELSMQEIDMQLLLCSGIEEMLAAHERADTLSASPQPGDSAQAELMPQRPETPALAPETQTQQTVFPPLQEQPAVPTAAVDPEPESAVVRETVQPVEESGAVQDEQRCTENTLERVHKHMREDGEPLAEELPPRRLLPDPRGLRGVNVLIAGLIVLLSAVLLWVIAGILMDLQVLPFVDLGYAWFNGNVFPLFRLPGAAGV